MKRKTGLALFVAVLATIAVSAYFLVTVSAQVTDPQVSDDAIGVRIIPNPSHYSVYRWYESQGFKGSPQALTVDGYEALRDGRTVYVNAAYIDTFSKQIYTNIYLISYNQNPNIKTVDILGQIISHWKFNENLKPEASTCSISALKCTKDSDCSSAQTCSTANATCVLKTVKNCEVDTDCPANFFCDSIKAKVIRDLKRVGKLEEVKESLASYKVANGHYPLLSGGTYLPGKTTSLWPSWNEVLMPALGIKQNIIDPINRLGMCPNYDSKTCWNNSDKKFVYDAVGITLKLPHDSYAMAYSTNDTGSEYNLCAVMESHDEPNYTLFPNNPLADSCISATGILASGNVSNATPQITDFQLKGTSGLEYNGFVRAIDSDKDPLTWTMSYVSTSWPNWSSAPTIKMTSDNNQRKIFADRAGNPGKYLVRITVTDTKGASVSTTTEIEIISAASFAQADDYTYHLDQNVPFSYSAYISGNTWSAQVISGPNILLMPGIVTKTVSDGLNRKKFIIQGIISTSTVFATDTETVYKLIVDGKAANNFVIRVKVDKPILKLDCPPQSRVGFFYSCRIGLIKQGSHNIRYGYAGVPGIGTQVGITDPEYMYLTGTTTQKSPGNIGQEIKFSALNEYGTVATSSFMLRVNDYCGDGVKQWPNSEGKGGVRNDGYESCDGLADVTTSAANSSKTRQYACNTTTIAKTPYPIISNNHCIFKSPLDGGGYCGDTYCQTIFESIDNCKFDCSPVDAGNSDTLSTGTGGVSNNNCNTNGVPCDLGYQCTTAGTCEKVCALKTETTDKVEIYEGDTLSSTACAATRNGGTTEAVCNSSLPCPSACNSRKVVSSTKTGNSDRCYLTNSTWWPWGWGKDWYNRNIYTCYKDIVVSRCYLDDCRTTGSFVINGYIDHLGNCVVKPVAAKCDTSAQCSAGQTCVGAVSGCVQKANANKPSGSPECSTVSAYQSACASSPFSGYCEWKVVTQGTCVTGNNNVCTPTCGNGYSCVSGQCIYTGGTTPPNPSCKTCDLSFCGDNGCGVTCRCSGSGLYHCSVNTSYICVLPCTAGTSGAQGWASQYNVPCTACVAGTYNTIAESATCNDCPSGNYCTGGTNLTPCPSGTARSMTGGTSSTSCTRCAAGTYNNTTGNSSCTICEANYYCTGGSNRTACTGGKRAPAGSDASADCVIVGT